MCQWNDSIDTFQIITRGDNCMDIPVWNKLTKQQKCAFVSTFIIGFLSHGMMLFNKFSNRDDLRYMFSGGLTFSLGRWMLFIAEKIKNILFMDSVYNIPTINGVVVLFCIAISLVLLIDLYKIHSAWNCILLSALFISIPVVAGMFGYMFIAQFFGIALLLAVLGPYIILHKQRWYFIVIGIILMTCSVGIYQAYIPVMICIFLFWLIMKFSQATTKEARICIYKKIPVIAVSLSAFLGLYAVGTNLFLKISGEELSGYKGIGSVTKISINEYLNRVLFAYKEFFAQTPNTFYNVFPGSAKTLFHISIILCLVWLIIYCLSIRKQLICLFYTLVLSFLIPLAVNFIFVMTDETYCNTLMMYGYVMFFLFFIWIFERIQSLVKSRAAHIFRTCTFFVMILLIFIFCRFDNLCYMRLAIVQSQTTRFYSTLITRMQSTPGYNSAMKVAYIGNPHAAEWDTTIPEIQELNYIHVHPYFGFRQLQETEPWRIFMEIWLNFKAWEEEPEHFTTLSEVKAMPCYPNDGSIQIIDGVLVVKFQDIEE